MVARLSRRTFLIKVAALAGTPAVLLKVRSANAQQPTTPHRIGVLLVAFTPESDEAYAFRHGLEKAGYVIGQDVTIDWRSAEGDYKRIPNLVAGLVRSKVEVIVTDS